MKYIIRLILIILMALYSYNVNSKPVTLYELFIDFGDGFKFSHEIFSIKKNCESKAKTFVKSDGVKAYCVERKQ